MKQRLFQVFIVLIFLLDACAPAAATIPVATLAIATVPVRETPSPLPTETALPTATDTPAPLPTLNPIRKTPPTLMLHRPNQQFNSLAFLKDFIKILQQNDMYVVTYQDIVRNPDITATEQEKLFIITIDDISLAYPMNRQVIEMIDVLREAGYPAVLGVVTETDYPYAETVDLLKELSQQGWEIATHTDHHANLRDLEKASEKLVYQEVITSLDKIEEAIGVRPITLVLPEGQMTDYMETLENMDLRWVVGINGGLMYDSRDEIIYVGREGPAKNAEYTYKIMKMRFGF